MVGAIPPPSSPLFLNSFHWRGAVPAPTHSRIAQPRRRGHEPTDRLHPTTTPAVSALPVPSARMIPCAQPNGHLPAPVMMSAVSSDCVSVLREPFPYPSRRPRMMTSPDRLPRAITLRSYDDLDPWLCSF